MAVGPAGYSEDHDIAATARAQLDRTAAVGAELADVQRRLVSELIELWPTSAWLAAGARSAKAWLLAYTPLSHQEALRLEQVAGLCAGHPALAEAVISGELPIKRAILLGRTVTEERARYLDEVLATLLELNAKTTDDEAFATALRFWAEKVDQELDVRRQPTHSLALTPSLFGGGELHAQLAPAAFATVQAAIAAWMQDPDAKDAPYRRSFRERQADALDDMAAASLAGTYPDEHFEGDDELEELRAEDTYDGFSDTDELDEQLEADRQGEPITDLEALRRCLRGREEQRRRRSRRRTRIRSGATVNAVVDIRTLLGLRERTDLDDLVLRGDGFHLTPTLLERLACDSGLLATLFDGPGTVPDANHRAERFSTAQRRALAARDRGCVFPGCTRPPRHCDAHHLRERSHGGDTVVSNGATLCRFHHRLVHEYGWRLLIKDGHWLAIDRHGQTWTGRPAPPAVATAA